MSQITQIGIIQLGESSQICPFRRKRDGSASVCFSFFFPARHYKRKASPFANREQPSLWIFYGFHSTEKKFYTPTDLNSDSLFITRVGFHGTKAGLVVYQLQVWISQLQGSYVLRLGLGPAYPLILINIFLESSPTLMYSNKKVRCNTLRWVFTN